MEALNRIELRGIVGEARITNVQDARVCNFSVCTTRAYAAASGEKVIETTWHKVAVWARTDKQAAYIARIQPGCSVHVCGRIKVKSYVRQDGTQTSLHEIVASRVEVLGEEITPESMEKRNQ